MLRLIRKEGNMKKTIKIFVFAIIVSGAVLSTNFISYTGSETIYLDSIKGNGKTDQGTGSDNTQPQVTTPGTQIDTNVKTHVNEVPVGEPPGGKDTSGSTVLPVIPNDSTITKVKPEEDKK